MATSYFLLEYIKNRKLDHQINHTEEPKTAKWVKAPSMVTTLKQANKNIEQSYNYFYKYIKTAQEKYGNIELCRILDKSDKYVFKIVKRGNTMAMSRLANLINAELEKRSVEDVKKLY